ncbi:NAD(P)/FAD-dependent oxidoreductase [Alloyangia pacifica]|uniref:NAD(P)/FAD-dependent oxidoreductase n=1 Tax=Alloyangia pacifica TaxID=311180 RepID=UPI001CD6C6F8|nr:FAD-dependent oxidoreductase [Alloyangia pacifica]MCA0997721.1 FAD-dependent oxidoreductase [Alloyangia pacifica]
MKKTVAVIGAGIVGVSTAIALLRDGHEVMLIDREGPATGTSHGNGGVLAAAAVLPVPGPGLWAKAPKMLLDPDQPLFLRWSYLPKLLPWLRRYMGEASAEAALRRARAIAPLIGDSLADHQALATGTPAEKWLVPGDYVYAYPDRAAFEADAFTWQTKSALGFAHEVLENGAFQRYDPAMSESFALGVRQPDHGRITDPGAYVKALAAHAQSLGARLVIGEVTDFAEENGALTGLRIGGETLPCDAAVITTGVWSGPLAKRLGVAAPLESERGYHLELWEPSMMPRAPVMFAAQKFVATPMEGRLRLAGIVEFGGLDAPPSKAPFELLRRCIAKAMPELTWKHEVEWMGHRPSVSDSLPLIGAAPGLRGAFLGFGHDHVGLTAGPKTGRLLAQLVSAQRPNIDIVPFSPDRFA